MMLMAFAGIIAISIAAVVWATLLKPALSNDVPSDVARAADDTLTLLRRDVSASQTKAVEGFRALVEKSPDFVEAHAGLVTALAFMFDDIGQRRRRLEEHFTEVNGQAEKLKRDKSPTDWENLALSFTDEAKKVKVEHDALLKGEFTQARDALAAAYQALGQAVTRTGELTPGAALAKSRAEAIYHSVEGSKDAIVLKERYRTALAGKATDGWIGVVGAEYVLNATTSTELIEQAAKEIDELIAADQTFIRAQVLSARLDVKLRRYDSALAKLDKVLALDPTHEVAIDLKVWLENRVTKR